MEEDLKDTVIKLIRDKDLIIYIDSKITIDDWDLLVIVLTEIFPGDKSYIKNRDAIDFYSSWKNDYIICDIDSNNQYVFRDTNNYEKQNISSINLSDLIKLWNM